MTKDPQDIMRTIDEALQAARRAQDILVEKAGKPVAFDPTQTASGQAIVAIRLLALALADLTAHLTAQARLTDYAVRRADGLGEYEARDAVWPDREVGS